MVTLFGIAMWTIMRLHWANIFDNHLYSTLLLRSTFLSSLQSHLQVICSLAYRKHTVEHFTTLWCQSPLINILPNGSLSFNLPSPDDG